MSSHYLNTKSPYGPLVSSSYAQMKRNRTSYDINVLLRTSFCLNLLMARDIDGDVYFHSQRERDRVARELVQPLVEEWAEQELEFTSLYGIREYYRGSELRMHVDRVATHVFSVIMNLHQVYLDVDTVLCLWSAHSSCELAFYFL